MRNLIYVFLLPASKENIFKVFYKIGFFKTYAKLISLFSIKL